MSDDLKQHESRHFSWLDCATGLAAALVLAVGATYYASIDAPFVYDDHDGVINNDSIKQMWPLPGPLVATQGFPTAGRPLVNLSFALNYHFGELHTRGYHLVNMVLHALSAMLLFGILRQALRLPFFAHRLGGVATPLALAVALVWAVHPLQTESVVYITQRTELMVGFFYLATLYLSLRYWQSDSVRARRLWLCLAVLAALGGMASKEVMATAPLMVLLFDRVFVSGSLRRAIAMSWPLYVGLAASWGLLLALNYHGPRSESAGFHLGVSPWEWWLTQSKVLLTYLRLVFWPWPLTIHYEMPYLTLTDAWPSLLATAALAITSLALLWRGYAAGFVGVWVFAILSPTLLVPIITEVAAERRMYLPLAGIVAIVIIGAYSLLQKCLRPSTERWLWLGALASALGVSVALAIVSHKRLAAYESAVIMWRDVLGRYPDSYFAYDSLGTAMVTLGIQEEMLRRNEEGLRDQEEAHERFEKAREHNEKALKHHEESVKHYEEAITHFRRSIKIKPDYDFANFNLGGALMSLDRYDDAIAQFEETLKIEENIAPAHWNLAALLCKTGRVAEGIVHFERALEIRPEAGQWHFELAEILQDVGFKRQAFVHFEQAAALRPQHAKVQFSFAEALQLDGRIDEAIPYYERAIAIEPNDASKRRILANALVAGGRTEEAIAQLQEAARLAAIRPTDGDDITIMGIRKDQIEIWISLAECYDHLGQGAEAVTAAERALELAQAGEDRDTIKRCEKLLTKCRADLPSADAAPEPRRPDAEATP